MATAVEGYCDTRSGETGCNGKRKVTVYNGFWFCDKHWRYRVKLATKLADRKRRNGT